MRGRIARDSEGRVRTEMTFGRKIVAIALTDPVEKKIYTLDPARRCFQVMAYHQSPPESPFEPPPDAEIRDIEGVRCFRITVPQLVEEAWFSPELQYVIAEERLDAGHRFVWRMFDIQKGEPPADLFKIPADFNTS